MSLELRCAVAIGIHSNTRGLNSEKGAVPNISDGSTPIVVATSIDDYKDYIDVVSAKDAEGAFGMILTKRIINLPSGTKVRVLDIDIGKGFTSLEFVKIRILEGSYYPFVGWINATVINNYLGYRR